MKKNHSLQVRCRAFKMWQNLGYFPWSKPRKTRKRRSGAEDSGESVVKSSSRDADGAVAKNINGSTGETAARSGSKDFYKGAFDSIPFLNEDAKRTFSHLLLRPGYMIRDYISGKHGNYLAPLTSLIVFYAFFALIASILQPIQHTDSPFINTDTATSSEFATEKTEQFAMNMLKLIQKGVILLNLDRAPEEVDTRAEVSIAALEGKLRSQGIPLFLGKFILLWLSMSIVLRKYKISMSGAAAASAYVLCQFSFFMIFALLLSFGESTSISLLLMAVLLAIDYRQWLDLRWRKSIGLVVRTGVFYGLMFLAIVLTISLAVTLVAWLKI